MQTVTVSEQGQIVIPPEICKQLGITPGCQLSFIVEGSNLRIEVNRRIQLKKPEDGYGLVCNKPGERHLVDWDTEAFPQATSGGLSEDYPDDISDDDFEKNEPRQELDK